MNIQARIKRNKLDILAGEFYQDEKSDFIIDLKKKGCHALVGLKRNDGIYTVIGTDFTYFCSNTGVKDKIAHNVFLEILKKNALKLDKSHEFEFVEIEDNCSVWVLNIKTMNALWNTIMFFEQVI